MPRFVAASALVAAFGVPSAAKVEHVLGSFALAAFVLALAAAVPVVARVNVASVCVGLERRHPNALALATLLALAAAFVVVLPRITLHSTRDEALDFAARELLHRHFPYRYGVVATGAPAGTPSEPITPLPGELLLAMPFLALFGTAAWQTFAWLAAFYGVSAVATRSTGAALACLWIVGLTPSGVQEVCAGGNLLANALWVLVLGSWLFAARAPAMRVAAAMAFGLALSSRPHFALVVPVLLAALARRWGWRQACARVGIALAGAAAVTLPIYLVHPDQFSPLHVATLFEPASYAPMATASAVAAVLGGVVALRRDEPVALLACAVVLLVPVAIAAGFAVANDGATGFGDTGWYATSSTPFGVLGGVWCLLGERPITDSRGA